MEEIKAMDADGIAFLVQEEGVKLTPYLDSVGIPTIGIGNTYYPDGRKVKMTDPAITAQRAVDMFRLILEHYEKAVWSNTRDDINQNQFNALCSITYNIGVNGFKGSTFLKLVNANPTDPAIKAAILMWKKPKKIIGRRKREVALYFK